MTDYCHGCERTIRLRKDGTFQTHNVRTLSIRCPGSGLTPKEAMERDLWNLNATPKKRPSAADPKKVIPYARAVIDDVGYGVICPACGLVCRAEGGSGSNDESIVEDDITKGAAKVYALHYERDHGEKP